MGSSEKGANGTNGANGASSNGTAKKPNKMVRRVCTVFCCPFCLYFGLLGLSPAVFEMYLNMYTDYSHVMPLDAPLDITNMEEVFGVHSYQDTLPWTNWNMDRPLIFRNFTDCAATFTNEILPRRADQVDEYREVVYGGEDKKGNVYSRGILNGEFIKKKLKDTVDEESPNMYASFLRIFDRQDYQLLLNTTWEYAKFFKMDSSFISYFSWPVVSSPIHAAPMVYTYSLQCYGMKSWLFWSTSTLHKHGIETVVHPAGGVISGSPQSIIRIPTLRANVGPGDLLFFPPLWYHAVASSAGKNIMFAMRRGDPKTFLSSFLISPRDCTLWFLRTMADKPAQHFKRIMNLFSHADAAQNRSVAEEAEEHKFGYTPLRVPPFTDKYGRARCQHAKKEMALYQGLEHFEMPEHERPGTTPGKVIQKNDEYWVYIYKEYKWPFVKDYIKNQTLRDEL